MNLSRIRRLCKTNKEALRWCKERNVKVDFSKSFCTVRLGAEGMIGKTLISSVNKWIKHFNLMVKNNEKS